MVIVMGVSGAGKSLIGERLAQCLKCDFVDGDAFHSAANKAKMASGTPLTDEDRRPWLRTIRAAIEEKRQAGNTAVFTCSSLKRSYRDILRNGDQDVCFIYLKGEFGLLHERLGARSGHFFNPALLQSQLDTLEEPGPDEAIEASIAPPADQVVDSVLARLAERFPVA
ncbi:MAG TPA: gluconokinase [Bordetella sp.]